MTQLQAVLYLIAIVLIAASALPFRRARGVNLALLGAAFALLAFALPTFNAVL
ncbi:hypothetical protein [Glycomyces tarimensis]